MSLVSVPVCSACGQQAISAVSCSDCCKIHCAECFGIPSEHDADKVRLLSLLSTRLCSHCKSEKPKQTPTRIKREQCWIHGNDLKLFCLSCEELICGDCFLSGGAHMRHQIDYVDTVYKEKRAETEQKLVLLKSLQNYDTTPYEKNLEIIETAEQSILEDIEMMYAQAKRNVMLSTVERKRVLQDRVELPAKKQRINDTLHEMVEKLPPVEFFKKQSLVHQQCDEMISSIVPDKFIPMQFDDIGCELIPPYEIQTYNLVNFHYPTTSWPQNRIMICDIPWNICVRKKDNLFVKVNRSDNASITEKYKLLVIIPHEDIRKTIQKTFILHGTPKEEVIVSATLLKNDNYITPSGVLVVKIGIRPINVVSENRVLKAQIRELKDNIDKLEKQLSSPERDVNCKFYIMHYNLNYANKPKKNQEAHHSSHILDRSDRHWCLRVYPMDVTKADTNLKAFIVLRKGSRTKCRYFIELIHDNPKNSVLLCTESVFETMDAGYGWHSFIDRKKLLSDVGFYPNGILRFRFGVQPIDN